jgi:hypothetical protein
MDLIICKILNCSKHPKSRITSFEPWKFKLHCSQLPYLPSSVTLEWILILSIRISILRSLIVPYSSKITSAPSMIIPRLYNIILSPWSIPWFPSLTSMPLWLCLLSKCIELLLLPWKPFLKPIFFTIQAQIDLQKIVEDLHCPNHTMILQSG